MEKYVVVPSVVAILAHVILRVLIRYSPGSASLIEIESKYSKVAPCAASSSS